MKTASKIISTITMTQFIWEKK